HRQPADPVRPATEEADRTDDATGPGEPEGLPERVPALAVPTRIHGRGAQRVPACRAVACGDAQAGRVHDAAGASSGTRTRPAIAARSRVERGGIESPGGCAAVEVG